MKPLNRTLSAAREHRLNSIFLPTAGQAARLMDSRMDATSVLHLARQLEELDAEVYEVEYPESVGVSLLPIKSNISPGAENYTYQSRDRVGEFTPSANLSDDSPNQDVAGDSETSPLYSWHGHFAYSVQDMRRSTMAGHGIDNDRALAARANGETKLDEVLATGYSALGITGFYNNSNVASVTADTGDWTNVLTDADEIVNDLEKMKRAIITASKGSVMPNMVVLSPTNFAAAETKRIANTTVSALDYFRSKNQKMRVEQWARGETAGVSGVRRIMMGRADRRTLEGLVPVRWETFPPEMRGTVYRVECHLRTGGVIYRYPNAWRFMDGC